MYKIIDLHDLPDEDVKLVEELVEFLEEKAKKAGLQGERNNGSQRGKNQLCHLVFRCDW